VISITWRRYTHNKKNMNCKQNRKLFHTNSNSFWRGFQLFASRCQNIILHLISSKYRQVQKQIQQNPTLRAMICFPRYSVWKTIRRQWFDPLNNIWSQWERRNYICNSNKTRTDLEYCFIIGGLATALKCCNRHRVIPNIIICYRKLYRFKSHLLRTNTV